MRTPWKLSGVCATAITFATAGGCLYTPAPQGQLTAQQQAEWDAYRQQQVLSTPVTATPARDMHHAMTRRRHPAPRIPTPRVEAVPPNAADQHAQDTAPRDAAAFAYSDPRNPKPLAQDQPSTSPSRPRSSAAPPPAVESATYGQSYSIATDLRNSRRHLFGELPDASAATQVSPLDDEGNLRRVTFTTEGADFDLDVDATGQWLAFASTRHRQTADIYLQRVNGTSVTQLTNDPARDEMPSLSPDGRRLAFASDRGGTFDIYLMEIEGGPAVKLTDDGAQNIHPSFSPDGQRLVYCSLGSQSGVWELVLLEVNRPGQRRIIGHGLFPVWSPTGNRIAYQRARERGSRWFSLWTMDVSAEGEVTRPVEVVASANAAVITPEWSPDGRNLVFCTVLDPTADSPAGSRADIWICNADGTGRTRLTHGRYGNLYPTWAADGSIYFVSNRGVDAIENVYALRPDQAVFLARRQEASPMNPEPRQPDSVEAQVPTPVTE